MDRKNDRADEKCINSIYILQLYAAKGKPELFITIDLQTIKIEEVWKSLIDIIKEASAVATGVKNSASKVKGN